MTRPALTLIRGGGIPEPAAQCPVCGVPAHPEPSVLRSRTARPPRCKVLTAHLDWLRMRGLSDTTAANRESQVLLLAAALPVPVLDAGRDHLAAWRAGLTMAPGGIANAVSHVTQFYAWAVADGLIDATPATGLPVPKRPRRYPRPIADADLFRALEHAPQPVRAWLVLAAWCGLRAQETARLLAANVHLDDAEPYLLVDSEAAKGARERLVPLSAFAVAELRAYGVPATGYLFGRADGRPGPNAPHVISHVANNYLRAAGIADTFHALRHRALTMAYRASHDIRAVQAFAGHQRIDSTAIYTAFADGAVRAAADAIPVPPQPGRAD